MSEERGLLAIVLAAGLGKRMKSEMPKVLHRVCGRPIVAYVLEAAQVAGPDSLVMVVGHVADKVKEVFAGADIEFALQDPQLGTGDAVKIAMEHRGESHNEILVLPGDSPLIQGETLKSLVDARRASQAAVAMLVTEMDDPTGYGRVIRDHGGNVMKLVEEADCDEKTGAIKEVGTCTYAFDAPKLRDVLGELGCGNAQGEYYLPDAVSLLRDKGEQVVTISCSQDEALGINDREQLAQANEIMRARINRELMLSGVTMVDPGTAYVDWGVEVERDTVLFPSVILSGRSHIGKGAEVGPFVTIKDSHIGDGARVQFAWLEGCEVAPDVQVGPFSRIRPGTRMGEESKAGSFVEIKNSTIGKNSKVPHLSYIGDADIGNMVNIGAGSITCNYDGKKKHRTIIEDGAFLGSDTMTVAPVRIGKNATTGAGSTIYTDVPDEALGIERTEQKNVLDYRKRKKKEGTEE